MMHALIYSKDKLPKGAKPFGYLIYADKDKLSTFGTQKGYPVIARCLNLPADIRNGDGFGGGVVIGWLPVVSVQIAVPVLGSCLFTPKSRLMRTLQSLESQALQISSVQFGTR